MSLTKRGDRVMTPAWAAEDMVRHFKPTGLVLDPCRGEGAFTDALADYGLLPWLRVEWCEADEGRDFYDWTDPVDWVIGNPPYSMTRQWFRHSYGIAENLLYLVPLRNVFSGFGFVREIYDFGGIIEIRVYGTGGKLGFPMGNAVGAFHIQREFQGLTRFSFFRDDHEQNLQGALRFARGDQ
jgi:hypothetical protein